MGTFKGILPGDRVKVRLMTGQVLTGTACPLLVYQDHVVLNMGGKYGRPLVANASNYVSHKSRPAARYGG